MFFCKERAGFALEWLQKGIKAVSGDFEVGLYVIPEEHADK